MAASSWPGASGLLATTKRPVAGPPSTTSTFSTAPSPCSQSSMAVHASGAAALSSSSAAQRAAPSPAPTLPLRRPASTAPPTAAHNASPDDGVSSHDCSAPQQQQQQRTRRHDDLSDAACGMQTNTGTPRALTTPHRQPALSRHAPGTPLQLRRAPAAARTTICSASRCWSAADHCNMPAVSSQHRANLGLGW
jgi:hypothetical protein